MKHLIWTALVFAACGGGATGPSAEDFDKAKEEARAFRPWAEFEAAIPAGMGEAKVDGDKHSWTRKDGEECSTLTVTRMADSVGSADVSKGACP